MNLLNWNEYKEQAKHPCIGKFYDIKLRSNQNYFDHKILSIIDRELNVLNDFFCSQIVRELHMQMINPNKNKLIKHSIWTYD